MCESLSNLFCESSNTYQWLLQQTHTQALARNEVETKRWQEYMRDHEELRERLLSLRDKLSHSIMVPLGNKALMRGKLVHTNEILVCLGDGWFAKQTAQQATDICQRRIQHCEEMLGKLKKEENLLASRRSFPFELNAFGGQDTQELIEPFDEEAEKQWRERHRQKEKEYRQKLAEIRKTQNERIETEEDIWKHLEASELQEELEDELIRLEDDIAYEEDSEEYEDDTDTSSNVEAEITPSEELCHEGNMTTVLKRRVSFKEDLKEDLKEEDKCEEKEHSDDFIHIFFKHSKNKPFAGETESDIVSPADIGRLYINRRVLKSILKQSKSVDYSPLNAPAESSHSEEINNSREPRIKAVIEDVVERSNLDSSAAPCERPVSRFKAARLANKR